MSDSGGPIEGWLTSVLFMIIFVLLLEIGFWFNDRLGRAEQKLHLTPCPLFSLTSKACK